MKKKIIFIILLLIIIVLTVLFFIHKYNTITYKEKTLINIGEKVPTIKDIVDKKDIKRIKSQIQWKKLKVEKNKVYYSGIYYGTFKFHKKNYPVKLIVKDKISPKIKNVKDIEIYVGDKIDLLKDIKVTDNSHDKLKTKVEGKYDLSKVGEYKLKVISIDKSKNKTEKEFKLTVKEKPKVKPETKKEETKNIPKNSRVTERNGMYYVDGVLIVNKTYPLPRNYNPGGLLNEFMTNFNNMKSNASNEGINLWIKSGFRSYSTQNTIYNNYVARDGQRNADTYSARPGHSEHQSGLAADINSLDQSWINTKEGKWLNNNCYKYGFIIRYPRGKEPQTGYIYEPWHIRYVGKDLAKKLYNSGNWITIEEYFKITSKYN